MKIRSKIRDYSVNFVEEISFKYDFYVIDRKVFNLHNEKFADIKREKILLIEAIEFNKSYIKCHDYINHIVASGVKRGDTICAIGGGIIQDITGFICSILYRGLTWDFVPTTLLAQCDSCIGGKTSINMQNSKNSVGNFNPPNQIYINLEFLKTLKEPEIQSGIGEIIKVAFIDDCNRISPDEIINAIQTSNVKPEIIRKSLEIKKEIIEVDEFDKGLRNIMNYGHTFGHAIESVTNFKVPHGIAVGLGIHIANKVSFYEHNRKNDDMNRVVINFLSKNKKYFDIFKSDYRESEYLNALKKDKKNTELDKITCIINNFSGKTLKKEISFDKIIKYVNLAIQSEL
jgi:3-dehydroquinate synthase